MEDHAVHLMILILEGYDISVDCVCIACSVKHIFSDIERFSVPIRITVHVYLTIRCPPLSYSGHDSWSSVLDFPQQTISNVFHNQPMAKSKGGPKLYMYSLKLSSKSDPCLRIDIY